jgi:hypothetical protein
MEGSHLISWTPDLHRAFDECKASLSRATLLAHPDPSAPLALVTDASTSAMGSVLQQRVHNARQPLAFFTRKLSPAQSKYSAYYRELLAVYEAVKHFRHMLEARHFIIFTDHKPITYAFQQKRDKCSPGQFNHIDFISQFTTDVRHISGQDNIVADALSRVEAITAAPSHDTLAASQERDAELQALLASDTALYGSRGRKSPASQFPFTATCPPGSLDRTSQLTYGSKCSSPFMACLTPAQRQLQGWSHSRSFGRESRRIVATGHGLASPASSPKSPAIQSLRWETSLRRQPGSCIST